MQCAGLLQLCGMRALLVYFEDVEHRPRAAAASPCPEGLYHGPPAAAAVGDECTFHLGQLSQIQWAA